MKMVFRGTEDIVVETMKTLESEIWYQDLKDIPSIELPERALVAAGMSLHWKMDREDKPVYMEDDRSKIWNLLLFLCMLLHTSPKLLLRTKAVKQKEVEAAAQPTKKPKRKTGKRGNLDAFVSNLSPEKLIPSACAESSSVFNDDLPPTSPHTSIRE
ncbi:hypothetical protein Hanom_Chr15g01397531 [Helianthus anomalus]